ncbi:hypothetical protein TC41_0727 [Alicyclobacillus acidocaldarius subsp. acidocaldarius Tc-4-1]|uniref:Uncharacterized protein n=1 Tax=Alicyclobacillus acidocaldarius (strain Tc-4-1) TaxID=1048834 RepID=F8IEH1_ALIAT|nr:hypothetical protein TC41_0727 [Alicyclobacillus acidocaldarius subsp. acidocaldarius Tc-4-1]
MPRNPHREGPLNGAHVERYLGRSCGGCRSPGIRTQRE